MKWLLVCCVLAIVPWCVWSCDIFVMSKCTPPPAPNEHNANWTLYCNEVKEHIDCINQKLKSCKNVQEFGPALETIKWNIKVLIEQGRSHGCADLVDKIKLPRVPRKKKTTTTTKQTTLMSEKTIVQIDPNCHKNLVDMYCERLEGNLVKFLFNNTLDETTVKINTMTNDAATCKKIAKYNQCLQANFRLKCEQSMMITFSKIDKLTSVCIKTKNKSLTSDSTSILIFKSNFFLFYLSSSLLYFLF